MVIKQDQLELVLSGTADEDLQELFYEYDDLSNLSELRLHQGKMPGSQIFRIELNGELIGEIGLKSIRWYNRKGEIHLALKKDFRGKGIGKKALLLMIDYAFNTLNFHRLEAEVVAYNKGSQKLFEKLGFRQEGLLREAKYYQGRYHDILRYGMLKSDGRRLPSP